MGELQRDQIDLALDEKEGAVALRDVVNSVATMITGDASERRAALVQAERERQRETAARAADLRKQRDVAREPLDALDRARAELARLSAQQLGLTQQDADGRGAFELAMLDLADPRILAFQREMQATRDLLAGKPQGALTPHDRAVTDAGREIGPALSALIYEPLSDGEIGERLLALRSRFGAIVAETEARIEAEQVEAARALRRRELGG